MGKSVHEMVHAASSMNLRCHKRKRRKRRSANVDVDEGTYDDNYAFSVDMGVRRIVDEKVQHDAD